MRIRASTFKMKLPASEFGIILDLDSGRNGLRIAVIGLV